MTLSEELQWRGFVNQTTLPDLSALDGEPVAFYFGVDPSANSMTIGNLASAMMVRHFIDYGHTPYLLVGGATGMIGDPDGKADERQLKTLDEIAKNKAGIAAEYTRVFAGKQFTIVDNYDWFKDINYLDFLRTIGKNVPLSQMLSRDFVQSRIGEGGGGISYAEFSYSLIQGYDFLHLSRQYGVSLQLAGSDQWGNSLAGVDLIRRLDGKETHVYTAPLIVNKTTGVKFGKSEGGAVWLNPDKTSVYAFYQFWLNAGDLDIVDWLKTFTLLPRDEVERLATQVVENPGQREAQKVLAHEVTQLVHGPDRTLSVERVTDALFGSTDFASLVDDDIEVLAAEIPVVSLGVSIVDALVSTGLSTSNGEAKRLIESGAVSVSGVKVDSDRTVDMRSLIKKGKNSFILVRS
jgi:tyrosyl-tRNA synthetase